MEPILSVQGLDVCIQGSGAVLPVLNGVDLSMMEGEAVGLVGESGCGKSMTALAVMGLLPDAARIAGGSIRYKGRELTSLSDSARCGFRGRELAMIFQEPGTALNPLIPVGKQIAEAYKTHHPGTGKASARAAALDLMRSVGLSRVESIYGEYPHRLSGGMKQRIVIAMALINSPGLLIADEPTTALDVTIQYQILELIRELNRAFGTSVLLVSHDFGVVRHACSRIVVMYAGYVVEEGEAGQVLHDPLHPYTQGLLNSIPTAPKRGKALYSIPGAVPSLQARVQAACPFYGRCPEAIPRCGQELPALEAGADGRRVRCHLRGEKQLAG